MPANPLHKIKQDRTGSKVYLIAYYSVNSFYLLWLSNGTFQASFKDHIDILIEKEDLVHLITQTKRSSFKLSDLSQQDEEIRHKVQTVYGAIKKVKRSRQANTDTKK